jgi:hypothetical protein
MREFAAPQAPRSAASRGLPRDCGFAHTESLRRFAAPNREPAITKIRMQMPERSPRSGTGHDAKHQSRRED